MLEHLKVAIIWLCMGISNEIKVPMIAIIKWNNDLWQHSSCVMTAKKSAKKGAADSEFWVSHKNCSFFFYILVSILITSSINPLNPNSDQDQFSPNNIHTL